MKPHYLAPLHRYTNQMFRLMVKKHKGNTIIPLVPARSIEKYPFFPIPGDAIQLFDYDLKYFEMAAKFITRNYPFIKWVDINAGCPSKDVSMIGGVKLLTMPKRCKDIINLLKDYFEEVSIKIRLPKTLDFIDYLQDADFIIIHGRNINEDYSSPARWEEIKKIKEISSVPIVGNGDISSLDKGIEYISLGYCDSFMIGRAAMKNPYIFEGKKQDPKKAFIEYYEICKDLNRLELFDLKQKALNFFSGFKYSSLVRKQISPIKSFDKLLDVINSIDI